MGYNHLAWGTSHKVKATHNAWLNTMPAEHRKAISGLLYCYAQRNVVRVDL